MASCICAARLVLLTFQRWRRSTSPLGEPRFRKAYPECRERQPESGSEAAEDGEGIRGSRLPGDLAAPLHLAVQAPGQGLGVLLGGRAHDQVLEAAEGVVALRLELLRERVRLGAGRKGDADLPRRGAPIELLLFPRLRLRLVVPALLCLEPVLDPARLGLAAEAAKLSIDHGVRALGLRPRGRVDEDLVAVPRDGQALPLEIARELARLLVELGAEPIEEPARVRLLHLDSNAPVVGHEPRAYRSRTAIDAPS